MGNILSQPLDSKLIYYYGNEHVRIGVCEMQGLRLCMEDTHNVVLSLANHPDVTYLGIFDGHVGDSASTYMNTEVPRLINNMVDTGSCEELTKLIEQADLSYYNTLNNTAGTTACVVTIQNNTKMTVANVGDSRCIVFDLKGNIKFATVDHKPNVPEEKTRIEKAGGFVTNGRVDGDIAMSRAIGDFKYKYSNADAHGCCLNTKTQKVQKMIATPTVDTINLTSTDIVLVCCDGIVEHLENTEVVAFICSYIECNDNNNLDPATIISLLFDHCLKSGSQDNMSAILMLPCSGVGYGKNKPIYIESLNVDDNKDDYTWMDKFMKYREKCMLLIEDDLDKINDKIHVDM